MTPGTINSGSLGRGMTSNFVKRSDDDTGHAWCEAGIGFSGETKYECPCGAGMLPSIYAKVLAPLSKTGYGKCPLNAQKLAATTTSARAASVSIPGLGPTQTASIYPAWPSPSGPNVQNLPRPKFAPRGADKTGHQWSRVDHPEDGDILECVCGAAVPYQSYVHTEDFALEAYSRTNRCSGAPVASNHCTQCRTELSSYLDVYYGKDPREAKRCSRCRGRS